MIRLLDYIIRLALLVALAVWLADKPGTVEIIWHNYEIETSASALLLAIIALGIALYGLFRISHLIKYGPATWRLKNSLKNADAGQKLIARGMSAIANGDALEAGRLVIQARKKLGPTTSVQWIQAQAAQLAGDFATARLIYQELVINPDSSSIGYRGLIHDARRREDWSEVEQLVKDFLESNPTAPWLNLIRFDLFVMNKDWQQASVTLVRIARQRLLDTTKIKITQAALQIALSQEHATYGRLSTALQMAEQAARQTPDWLPAIINLAQQQAASGHLRAASRTVRQNWDKTHHPQLAAIYCRGDVNALESYKKLQKLCERDNFNPSSLLILAEAAVTADIWGEARQYLNRIIQNGRATRSVYKIFARLERRESGDEHIAQRWLGKASDASPDPVWMCQLCGGTHQDWQVECAHCHQFNTLDWQTPGRQRKHSVLPQASHLWIEQQSW